MASGVVTGWSVEKEVTGFADQPVQIPISWEEADDQSKLFSFNAVLSVHRRGLNSPGSRSELSHLVNNRFQ